jgi:transposase
VGYNFVSGDRDQLLLMPPSVADWLPEDHLAWFVLDVVAELDLSAFRNRYRADGRGGAAYDPQLMLGVLVYGYCVGERSSRRIERRLVEDVAFRVVAANQQPDHATIARFRAEHEDAIAGLFGQVVAVCSRAGLLRPGLVAIDGTKLAANASREASRTAEQLAKEILAEAAATDAAEDAAEVQATTPPPTGGREGRRERLRAMLAELEAEAAEVSYEAHLARRAAQEAATGKRIRGKRPVPGSWSHSSRQHANLTDPDSRIMKTRNGYLQGYNAQAVATTDQFVIAAQVTNLSVATPSYVPMIQAAKANLKAAGEHRRVRRVVADAGYWSKTNAALTGVESFIAPGRARQLNKIAEAEHARAAVLERVRAGHLDKAAAATELGVSRARVNQLLRRRRTGQADPLTATMIAKLDSPRGRRTYKKRAATIEPVFAQVKHNRGIRSLTRRGLAAADSEWKLICATHNLLKLHRLQLG